MLIRLTEHYILLIRVTFRHIYNHPWSSGGFAGSSVSHLLWTYKSSIHIIGNMTIGRLRGFYVFGRVKSDLNVAALDFLMDGLLH